LRIDHEDMTELSSAAKAILESPDLPSQLETLADRVAPQDRLQPIDIDGWSVGRADAFHQIRMEILTIVAELRGADQGG
jgi:hypothetical protein